MDKGFICAPTRRPGVPGDLAPAGSRMPWKLGAVLGTLNTYAGVPKAHDPAPKAHRMSYPVRRALAPDLASAGSGVASRRGGIVTSASVTPYV